MTRINLQQYVLLFVITGISLTTALETTVATTILQTETTNEEISSETIYSSYSTSSNLDFSDTITETSSHAKEIESKLTNSTSVENSSFDKSNQNSSSGTENQDSSTSVVEDSISPYYRRSNDTQEALQTKTSTDSLVQPFEKAVTESFSGYNTQQNESTENNSLNGESVSELHKAEFQGNENESKELNNEGSTTVSVLHTATESQATKSSILISGETSLNDASNTDGITDAVEILSTTTEKEMIITSAETEDIKYTSTISKDPSTAVIITNVYQNVSTKLKDNSTPATDELKHSSRTEVKESFESPVSYEITTAAAPKVEETTLFESTSQKSETASDRKVTIPLKSATHKRSLNATFATKPSKETSSITDQLTSPSTTILFSVEDMDAELSPNKFFDNSSETNISNEEDHEIHLLTREMSANTTLFDKMVSSEHPFKDGNSEIDTQTEQAATADAVGIKFLKANENDLPSTIYTNASEIEQSAIHGKKSPQSAGKVMTETNSKEEIKEQNMNSSAENISAFPGIMVSKSPDGIGFNFVDHEAKNEPSGITFDPNGLSNDDIQDPDSITFSLATINSNTPDHDILNAAGSELVIEIVNNNLTKAGNIAVTTQSVTNYDNRHSEHETREMEYLENDNHFKTPFAAKEVSHEGPEFEDIISKNDSEYIPSNHTSLHEYILITPEKSESSNFPGKLIQNITLLPMVQDDSAEMLNDAPHLDETEYIHSTQNNTTEAHTAETEKGKKIDGVLSATDVTDDSSVFMSTIIPSVVVTETLKSDYPVEPLTFQSVIRPVRIRFTSPADESKSTSILPDSSLTKTVESVTTQSSSFAQTTAQTVLSEKNGPTSPETPSPSILPNPAPVVTEKTQSSDLSTTRMQPELPVALNASEIILTEPLAVDNATNSTIAGVAVKTSVSVSLPLSKLTNSSENIHPVSSGSVHKNANISFITGPAMNFTSVLELNTDSNRPSVESTTDTTTPTTSAPRILKPKIRIPGTSDAGTRRTRKPFTPSLKRPTTTAGPPVSIFKKARTRIASITSSTTANTPIRLSTLRIHYADRIPPGMLPPGFTFPDETVPTTVPTTTTTEEEFSVEPFTDTTFVPTVSAVDEVILLKVEGSIVVNRGLRWIEQLSSRHSPEYKEVAKTVHLLLERLFRSSPIAPRVWKIEIEGFSGSKKERAVTVDFILYLIKADDEIAMEHLASVFHQKLKNNTFDMFRMVPSQTSFRLLNEEPLNKATVAPENTEEPPIPQWAIAVIVIGAASLIFIVLFAAVTMYGRHHMRRRYSNKLSEEDSDHPGEWERKMAEAYENLAADSIYDVEDLHSNTYKKGQHIATFHGRPTKPKRGDSWSSSDWTTQPRRQRPHVHRIVY